jgi:dTDP-4-amino-4,6-dideoxygalactose transaminase
MLNLGCYIAASTTGPASARHRSGRHVTGLKMPRDSFLVFGSPSIEEDEIQEVVDCLRSGWIGSGPRVERFEQLFRGYIGADHALAVSSCTAALHLCLIAAGIGPGDEVITSPLTFASTANCVVHVRATPIFADVELETMNIDPAAIEAAMTTRTRAIIPVHLAGRPCRMNAIMEIARSHNLLVIEDAAHAIEAWHKGKKIGTVGDATCFSFYVTKNLVTGEGGMATTSRADWAEKIGINRLHGLSRHAWQRYTADAPGHYQVMAPGFKYNMTDVQASLGIHQLARIERYLERREKLWGQYDDAFQDLAVRRPSPPEPDTRHARHLYTLLVDQEEAGISRDEFRSRLHALNIGSGVHFIALHLHPYYAQAYGLRRGQFPNAEFISDRTVSLPLSAKLTDRDVHDVIEAVRAAVPKRRP